MNAYKTLLAVSILAAAASAQATVYSIVGTLDSTANSASGVTIYQNQTPYNGTYPSTFTANQTIGLTGSLDITGTSISSGSLSLDDYGVLTSLSGANTAFGAVFDSIGSGYSFTGSGAGWVITGSGISNCVGPASGTICGPASAGAPPISYTLTSTGTDTYHLLLTSGSEGQITSQDFSLTASSAPAVPVPAAAWLMGSGLVGLAGVARRRRAKVV
jgi:hypothetical protein